MKVNVLDDKGFYLCDFVVGVSGPVSPDSWTSDVVGDGYYKAQYQNATKDIETGEWSGGVWVETGGPSKEQLIAIADHRCNTLMKEALHRMGPLQDAVDLDIATDTEADMLRKWKVYRVALNRLDTSSAPDIIWPVPPEYIDETNLPGGIAAFGVN